MKYRKFEKLDWEVSALGFGTMRLSFIGGDFRNIDEPEAIKMMRALRAHSSINYIKLKTIHGTPRSFLTFPYRSCGDDISAY